MPRLSDPCRHMRSTSYDIGPHVAPEGSLIHHYPKIILILGLHVTGPVASMEDGGAAHGFLLQGRVQQGTQGA